MAYEVRAHPLIGRIGLEREHEVVVVTVEVDEERRTGDARNL